MPLVLVRLRRHVTLHDLAKGKVHLVHEIPIPTVCILIFFFNIDRSNAASSSLPSMVLRGGKHIRVVMVGRRLEET